MFEHALPALEAQAEVRSAPRRYAILGMQRSGTTVTHHCLRHHPEVSALTSEVGVVPYFSQGITLFSFGQGGSDHERAVGHLALFDAITGLNAQAGTNTLGLKVAVATPDLARLLVDALQAHLVNLQLIILRRSDLLAQYASLRRAQATGQWHFRTGEERTAPPDLSVSRYELTEYVLDALEIHAHFDRLDESHRVLNFSYEDDIQAAEPIAWEKLYGFLGITRLEPTWLRSQKISPPVEDALPNAAELRTLVAELTDAYRSGQTTADLRRQFGRPRSHRLARELRRGVSRARAFVRRIRAEAQ